MGDHWAKVCAPLPSGVTLSDFGDNVGDVARVHRRFIQHDAMGWPFSDE